MATTTTRSKTRKTDLQVIADENTSKGLAQLEEVIQKQYEDATSPAAPAESEIITLRPAPKFGKPADLYFTESEVETFTAALESSRYGNDLTMTLGKYVRRTWALPQDISADHLCLIANVLLPLLNCNQADNVSTKEWIVSIKIRAGLFAKLSLYGCMGLALEFS
jgi:hypothetical protein